MAEPETIPGQTPVAPFVVELLTKREQDTSLDEGVLHRDWRACRPAERGSGATVRATKNRATGGRTGQEIGTCPDAGGRRIYAGGAALHRGALTLKIFRGPDDRLEIQTKHSRVNHYLSLHEGYSSYALQGHEELSMPYRLVLQRDCYDIETLYWNGTLPEAISLGRKLASEIEVDKFQIIDFSNNNTELYSEKVTAISDKDLP